MSYYFAIIGTKDNPIFEHEFGTLRHGGDGLAHFREDARHMNPFIVHSSLDIVEEVQWTTGAMYLKNIDRFQSSHVACFMTGTGMKFLLLFNPDASAAASSRPQSSASSQRMSGGGASVAFNPASAASEESMRAFFADVYENWVKTTMNPFYKIDMEIRSPVFRQRVGAAAKRHL